MGQIFCPKNHLMLAETRCPECGWLRPQAPSVGKFAWEPRQVTARLGGPGHGAFFHSAGLDGVAVFAHEGALLGICLADGRVLWQQNLEEGYVVFGLTAIKNRNGSKLIASICDRHPLLEAKSGSLAEIDPESGTVTPLWQSDSPDLSLPVGAAAGLCVRTSKPKLVFFDDFPASTPHWEVPLKTWWAVPPLVTANLVVVTDGQAMQQVGRLCAYQTRDGSLLWDTPLPGGLLTHLPAADVGVILSRGKTLEGRHYLASYDQKNGEQRWKQEFKNLYSPPIAAGGVTYIVRRGISDKKALEYYLLAALNSSDGTEVWQKPLEGRRAQWIQLINDSTMLLMSDDGRISCLDMVDQTWLWEQNIGNENNPPKTIPLLSNGLVVVGTHFGEVGAVCVQAEEMDLSCDPESEAASLALQGKFTEAGRIYQERLQAPRKAFLLFERGECWEDAGKIALQLEEYDQARTLFKKAGNHPLLVEVCEKAGEIAFQHEDFERARILFEESGNHEWLAKVLEKMQDWLNAADEYRKAGNLPKAAENFECGGNLRTAMNLYRECGDFANFQRLRDLVPLDTDEIEKLPKEERADVYRKTGKLRQAIDLYQELCLVQKELSTLIQFNGETPERWSQERQATLARQTGNFLLEAQTYQALGQLTNAAQAYWKAAMQAEQRQPEQVKEIGNLYKQAMQLFEEEGILQRAGECWERVVQFHKLPWVEIEGGAPKSFREGEFNTVELSVKNVGAGVALNIQIHPLGNRFEVDRESTGVYSLRSLGIGQVQIARLFIRPLMEQIGDNVPFVLEWIWEDRARKPYQRQISTSVVVKRRDESHAGSTPVVINAQNYIQGTYVDGDQFQNGAQKGDKIEIHRKGTGSLQLSTDTEPQNQILCPNCSLPVKPNEKRCDQCGHLLEPDQQAEAE